MLTFPYTSVQIKRLLISTSAFYFSNRTSWWKHSLCLRTWLEKTSMRLTGWSWIWCRAGMQCCHFNFDLESSSFWKEGGSMLTDSVCWPANPDSFLSCDTKFVIGLQCGGGLGGDKLFECISVEGRLSSGEGIIWNSTAFIQTEPKCVLFLHLPPAEVRNRGIASPQCLFTAKEFLPKSHLETCALFNWAYL